MNTPVTKENLVKIFGPNKYKLLKDEIHSIPLSRLNIALITLKYTNPTSIITDKHNIIVLSALTLSGPNTWEWDKFVPFLHIEI
jgi:hypothetical protein